MINDEFNSLALNPKFTIFPKAHEVEILKFAKFIKSKIIDGAKNCGLAKNQQAYDQAVTELFQALDSLDNWLKEDIVHLVGDQLTYVDL